MGGQIRIEGLVRPEHVSQKWGFVPSSRFCCDWTWGADAMIPSASRTASVNGFVMSRASSGTPQPYERRTEGRNGWVAALLPRLGERIARRRRRILG